MTGSFVAIADLRETLGFGRRRRNHDLSPRILASTFPRVGSAVAPTLVPPFGRAADDDGIDQEPPNIYRTLGRRCFRIWSNAEPS